MLFVVNNRKAQIAARYTGLRTIVRLCEDIAEVHYAFFDSDRPRYTFSSPTHLNYDIIATLVATNEDAIQITVMTPR